MSDQLILSVDQGTTNTKALLVNRDGKPIFRTSVPVRLLQPQPGFVEQDPIELWQSVCLVLDHCATHAHDMGARIAGIAISNQRETALAWRPAVREKTNEAHCEPIGKAMSWQCRRSSGWCERLSPYAARIRQVTGLPLDPLASAGKWAWLFENQPELIGEAADGRLLLGNIESWILYNLTGGNVHATDHTNASRTALLNLKTLDWDTEMLNLYGIPRPALPLIQKSSHQFGICTIIPKLFGIPIVSAIGDSHAAMAGHGKYCAGAVKATYGTGSSLMTLTPALVEESDLLARTIAWSVGEDVQFALEGNIAMTGSAVQWVGEFLQLSNPTADAVALAESVPDAAGVIFVPAMLGLGAPYWDSAARGMVANLERSHTAAHLARAAVDAISFQVADVYFAMEHAAGIGLPCLMTDGGATRNRRLMQMQADVLDRPVYRSSNEDLSALGAAWLGGLTLGWWSSLADLEALPKEVDEYRPSGGSKTARQLYREWRCAVERARMRGDRESEAKRW